MRPSFERFKCFFSGSTLHAFWKLPAPAVQHPTAPIHNQAYDVLRCEDCDAALGRDAGGMDADGDVGMAV